MTRATSPVPGKEVTEMTTIFAPVSTELQDLTAQPTPQALPRAAAFLADLVQDRQFQESHVLPVLEEARGAERWYVARRWDAPDKTFSLQVFVWPPGTRTMIHDHSSWGAYACAAGTVFEERYERLDDGSRFEHARLEEAGHPSWGPQAGPSTGLPATGASTGSVTRTARRRSRFICTGPASKRWTAVTTTLPATTSATGWTIPWRRPLGPSSRTGPFMDTGRFEDFREHPPLECIQRNGQEQCEGGRDVQFG